jgi:hypothetical protein
MFSYDALSSDGLLFKVENAGVVVDVAEILISVLIFLRGVTGLHWIGHI